MAEFHDHAEEYSLPEEFQTPAPEFPPVGAPAAPNGDEKAKRRRKQRIIYAIAAAALVLVAVGPFRLFSGSGSAAEPVVIPATAQPDATPAAVPDATVAPAEVTATPAPTPAATFVKPDCEVYLTSFYSEFRGVIVFRDMDDAKTVTLEYWDPETDSLEMTEDITDGALSGEDYNIAPFSTDFVYEHHRDYYEEKNSFPMTLEARVLVEYDTAAGTETATFSALSSKEVGWHVEYIPTDTDRSWGWVNPGCFQVQSKDSRVEYEIIYGADMPESENYIFVTMEIDGEPVRLDPSTFTRVHDDYDVTFYENGEMIPDHFHTTMLVIPMPEGYAEGEGHVATFTVRQYLTGAEKAVAFKQEVEF